MSRIGNPDWSEIPIWDDDYPPEDDELSPLDDDYTPEEYRDEEY